MKEIVYNKGQNVNRTLIMGFFYLLASNYFIHDNSFLIFQINNFSLNDFISIKIKRKRKRKNKMHNK